MDKENWPEELHLWDYDAYEIVHYMQNEPEDDHTTSYVRKDVAKSVALDEIQKEVEGYLPEFGAGDPQDGTDLIIDQCWRDFRKMILRLKGQ